MPLTLRPYSANTYVLSKVWFKCSSVNLRVQDITTINRSVKSWLYQDCLEKPCELVLYRQSKDGGLGLLNVDMRSLAYLIRSFLETASNPAYYTVYSTKFCSDTMYWVRQACLTQG